KMYRASSSIRSNFVPLNGGRGRTFVYFSKRLTRSSVRPRLSTQHTHSIRLSSWLTHRKANRANKAHFDDDAHACDMSAAFGASFAPRTAASRQNDGEKSGHNRRPPPPTLEARLVAN